MALGSAHGVTATVDCATQFAGLVFASESSVERVGQGSLHDATATSDCATVFAGLVLRVVCAAELSVVDGRLESKSGRGADCFETCFKVSTRARTWSEIGRAHV